MLRNAAALTRLARERHCDVIHALGRAAAWSAYLAARLRGIPFVTSWYKGFREQNILKRLYNGIMARGDRVIAVSEQIAQLINDRYGTPWERIAVVPCEHRSSSASIRPSVARERIEAMRARLGRQARHQGDPDRRPHPAPQGPSRGGARRCSGSRTWG